MQVNPIHTILKYGIYYDFMDRLWCSSKEFHLMAIKRILIIHDRNYLFFKIHLIAIDWSFKDLHHYLSIKS